VRDYPQRLMSALGQKQTCAAHKLMSAKCNSGHLLAEPPLESSWSPTRLDLRRTYEGSANVSATNLRATQIFGVLRGIGATSLALPAKSFLFP
jgi:hypothetical protein